MDRKKMRELLIAELGRSWKTKKNYRNHPRVEITDRCKRIYSLIRRLGS